MNNKLYNKIMKDISNVVKKSLNESEDYDLTPYLDKDGYINLEDLTILPKEIILNLCQAVIDSDYEVDCQNGDYDYDGDTFFLIPRENDNIYLESIDAYGVSLTFHCQFLFELDPGQEGSYWDEPIPPSLLLDHIVIEDIMLEDGYKGEDVEITDENIKQQLIDVMEGQDRIISDWAEELLDCYEDMYNYEYEE